MVPAGRVLGDGGNMRKMQCRAVGRAIVARGLRQPYGVARRHLVEIGRQDIAPFCEFSLVPAVALQPLTGFEGGNSRLNPPYDLRNAGGVAELHVIQHVDPGLSDMGVTVDQPRGGGAAAQIDALGRSVGETGNFLIRADSP